MPITKQHKYKTKSRAVCYKSLLLLFALLFGYGIANAGNNSAHMHVAQVEVATSLRLAAVVPNVKKTCEVLKTSQV